MTVWLDGDLVDDADATVSVFDHGVTTGDGVFETIKVVHGRPFALTRHLRRLGESARGLGLPTPDEERLRKGVDELLRASPEMPAARLRITLTGGVSPLGSRRGDSGPALMLALAPLDPVAASGDIATVPWPRNERGALAGVKSTSYAENVIALAYAKDRGAGEAVFANTAGNVCEGTGTNIFVVLNGEAVTPPLSAGCLAGVTRGLVLEWCSSREGDLPMHTLTTAAEAFLTSTARDVQPVRTIDGRELPRCPGPVTRAAMDVFARRSSHDDDP